MHASITKKLDTFKIQKANREFKVFLYKSGRKSTCTTYIASI